MTDNLDSEVKILKKEISELEASLEFSKFSVKGGYFLTVLIVLSGLLALALGAYTLVETGEAIFNGFNSGVIFALAIPALCVYFAFAFGREARIRVKLTQKTKDLESIQESTFDTGTKSGE